MQLHGARLLRILGLLRATRVCIFVCVQLYSTTLFGVPFPLPTPQGAGIGNSGTSPRPRFEIGNPQDKWQLRQTYSERSTRVATRPESKIAPPHKLNLPRRLSPPSHAAMVRLTGGYAWCEFILVARFQSSQKSVKAVVSLRKHSCKNTMLLCNGWGERASKYFHCFRPLTRRPNR
jgi:hypothetical protein